MSHPSPASPTHVSESEASPSEPEHMAEERPADTADKELIVLEHVVGALLSAKKRKLAELIQRDYACMTHRPEQRSELRRLAIMRWPQLEKELVGDLARALRETRRAHASCAKQLEAVKLENAVLLGRLAARSRRSAFA